MQPQGAPPPYPADQAYPPGPPGPPPELASGRPGGQPPAWTTVLMGLLAIAVGIWTVVVTALVQGVGWLFGDVATSVGEPVPGWFWPVLAWAGAGLVALPSGLLWLLATVVTPNLAGVRAAGRAWTTAALATGVLGSLRAAPMAQNELLLGLTALAAAALAAMLHL
ncbi:MAG TPA: hypothetical protein VF163_21030, partial [Micromonosporaceae bacterium]